MVMVVISLSYDDLSSREVKGNEVCCILYLTRYGATGAAHLRRFANCIKVMQLSHKQSILGSIPSL